MYYMLTFYDHIKYDNIAHKNEQMSLFFHTVKMKLFIQIIHAQYAK